MKNLEESKNGCNFASQSGNKTEVSEAKAKGLRFPRFSGVVVQLVRIHACHAWGRGFESRPYRRGERKSSSVNIYVTCCSFSFILFSRHLSDSYTSFCSLYLSRLLIPIPDRNQLLHTKYTGKFEKMLNSTFFRTFQCKYIVPAFVFSPFFPIFTRSSYECFNAELRPISSYEYESLNHWIFIYGT